MSIITRFLAVVTEPQFKLARDLTAMAIADGEVTPEEKNAISTICHLEGIDEAKLMEALRSNFENVSEEMPSTKKDREGYLRDIIRLIGADGYAAPQEIYLFQIIASKIGLNQMDVVGLFLSSTRHQYFQGDTGSKVFNSFIANHINPKANSECKNRENLRKIYDTVASHTEVHHDEEVDREILRQTLAHATETLLENKILVKEFAHVGVDFVLMAKEEERNTFERYTSI